MVESRGRRMAKSILPGKDRQSVIFPRTREPRAWAWHPPCATDRHSRARGNPGVSGVSLDSHFRGNDEEANFAFVLVHLADWRIQIPPSADPSPLGDGLVACHISRLPTRLTVSHCVARLGHFVFCRQTLAGSRPCPDWRQAFRRRLALARRRWPPRPPPYFLTRTPPRYT